MNADLFFRHLIDLFHDSFLVIDCSYGYIEIHIYNFFAVSSAFIAAVRSSGTGASSIAAAAKEDQLTMEELFAAANEGEPCACRSMDQVIRWFTVLIRSMIIFHDPQKIIIQGIYQNAGSYFLENLRSAVVSTPLFRTGADLLIDYAPYQFNEALITGASYYVCCKFLDNNQLYD